MIVKLDLAAVKETRWHDYALRFVLGGVITACAGAIGNRWGPAAGGLFLAFPAIFPASVTLIERRERDRKRLAGLGGEKRAADAAGADAAGATIGSAGLVAFAALGWWAFPRWSEAATFAAAISAWCITAACIWWLRKRHFFLRRKRNHVGAEMTGTPIARL